MQLLQLMTAARDKPRECCSCAEGSSEIFCLIVKLVPSACDKGVKILMILTIEPEITF